MKRPELLVPIAKGLIAGSGHRQLARSLECAPSTVTRIAARIGRHCLLLQAWMNRIVASPPESVVVDRFISFVFSQRDRAAIAMALGSRSWFDYGPEYAGQLGQPRDGVKKRALTRPLPDNRPDDAVESVRRVLDRLMAGKQPVTIVSDGEDVIIRAVRTHPARERITHHVFPNPPRRTAAERQAARERDFAMRPIDHVHQFIRHSQAQHRRETIAQGRRSNATMERAFLMGVWRNLVKGRRENDSRSPTPAMQVGLTTERITWQRVLAQRLFPGRIPLSPSWITIYRRDLVTPAVGRNVRHRLRHAY